MRSPDSWGCWSAAGLHPARSRLATVQHRHATGPSRPPPARHAPARRHRTGGALLRGPPPVHRAGPAHEDAVCRRLARSGESGDVAAKHVALGTVAGRGTGCFAHILFAWRLGEQGFSCQRADHLRPRSLVTALGIPKSGSLPTATATHSRRRSLKPADVNAWRSAGESGVVWFMTPPHTSSVLLGRMCCDLRHNTTVGLRKHPRRPSAPRYAVSRRIHWTSKVRCTSPHGELHKTGASSLNSVCLLLTRDGHSVDSTSTGALFRLTSAHCGLPFAASAIYPGY